MTEGLRDSGYEQCAAVDKTTEDEAHPDYLELSNSTYDKIPEHHFDGEDDVDNSHPEYTTPSDVADSLKDSLQYEKPIQVVRPLSKLHPQRQQNYYVQELPKNRPISPDQCSLELEKQNTSQIQTLENDVQSNKRQKSRRSKRPCVIGVGLILILIIGSAIATSMVLYFKEEDKSNTNKQQQDTAEENKSTIQTTPFSTVSTIATMTESVSFPGSTVLPESNLSSPTTVSATVGRTESSEPTTTTATNAVATIVTTSTPNPTTTTSMNAATNGITTSGLFKDCKDLKLNGYSNDGVYTIHPYLPETTAVRVYCDMTTDGGGWTVFQHRRDGSVDFYLLWNNFKNGFGEPNGEYWLGNDNLHQLTSLGTSDFYVRLEKFTGGWAYAKYNEFSVADESDGYRMRLKVGSYRGNAGDSIESHGTTNTNGYKFSTSDLDNDNAPSSCAVARKGAWWHNICTWANLNGSYGNGTCAAVGNCNFWYSLTNSYSGVKTSFMMVRRV